MSGFHILRPTWSLSMTSSSTNEATTETSGANLSTTLPSEKWRSNNLTTVQATLDAGSALPWNVLMVRAHNGSSDGQLRVTTHSSTGALFSSPSYEKTVPIRFDGDLSHYTEYDTWVVLETTQTYRYIGLEILDSGNPDGYFQAGVVIVGQIFTPRIGANLGGIIDAEDPSVKKRLTSGEAVSRAKRIYKVGQWTFPKQPALDVAIWRQIRYLYGSNTPLVAKFDPVYPDTEQDNIIYGYAQWRRGGAVTFVNADGLQDVEFGIEEI